MDDDDALRALIRAIVIEEVRKALGDTLVRRPKRLSLAQLEQRRAAAVASASERRKMLDKRERQRTGALRAVETRRQRKPPEETTTSNGPVNGAEHPAVAAVPAIAPSTQVWLRYSTAFKLRYGAFPPRNGRVNGLLNQLLKLIPMADAPDVAEFYVRTDDPLYVRANHPLTLLVRDAEKLQVMTATGRVRAETAAPQPWWRSWSGLQEQAKQLGIDEGAYDNPTMFRRDVLVAAAAWGSLPDEARAELGMHRRPEEG
jgi:hypothetical protein